MDDPTTIGSRPVVSVLVTTRNEEHNIANCLESVLRQTYPRDNMEIIVVDNDSKDKTRHIAERYADRVLDGGPERAAQRNLGARVASGKYVLYLDADMILSRELVDECVRKCDSENYAGLCIPERIMGTGFWAKVRDFERSFYDATCIDAARFVRRDIFLQLGGFDETLTGPEDWDLDRRIRMIGKVGIVTSRLFHNETGFAVEKYLTKKRYYSGSLREYREKWGEADPTVRKQLGVQYRMLGVFVEGGKWKRLLRHPILTSGMYYLRLRAGLAYMSHPRAEYGA